MSISVYLAVATKEPLWLTALKWPLSFSWVSKCLPNFFSFRHASFLSPLPIFRGPFLLSSAVPLSGPYWEDRDRHSAPPKVCLPVWSALVLNKSPQTLPTHSNPPPQTMSTRESQTLPVCPLSLLSHISSLLSWQRSFNTSLLYTVSLVGKFAASKAGLPLLSDPAQMKITGLSLYQIF